MSDTARPESDLHENPHTSGMTSDRESRPYKRLSESARAFLKLAGRHRLTIAFALIAETGAMLLGLIPPIATKFAVDFVIGTTPRPGFLNPVFQAGFSRGELLVLIACMVFLTNVMRSALAVWGRWLAARSATRIQLSVRKRIFEQAVRLPLHRVEEIRSGGLMNILRKDGTNVGALTFTLFHTPWAAIVRLVGSLLVLAWVDWLLLLSAMALLPIAYFAHRTRITKIRGLFRRLRQRAIFVDGLAAQIFAGIRVVRTFGRQRRECLRFMRENNQIAREELRAWWLSQSVEVAWQLLIPLGSAGVLLYGGFQTLEGRLTLGDLMMFLVYALMLLRPMASLATSATALQRHLASLDRVLDLLDEPRECPSFESAVPFDRSLFRGAVELHDVSFTYPGTTAPVLERISLKIAPGQVVAFVGPSGAGKTTLCSLISRLYDPTSGRITLDGIDLRNIEPNSYRSLLGVVEQEVFLFDGSLAANIAYSRRDATMSDVRRAAESANVSEFVARLDSGFETMVGESGVRLSGGQKQRIAIARAILANPGILVLDEATSNLDTQGEKLIQSSLEQLMQGRTTFIVAHRLSTVFGADQIVLIDQGRIVESGTHSELIAANGHYRRMLEQQRAIGSSSD